MQHRFVTEDVAAFRFEDHGKAAIAHIDGPEITDDNDDGWFVRVQSWASSAPSRAQATGHHPIVAALQGKRVRVTIELLED